MCVFGADSRYLFKYFIGINDNWGCTKIIKATKLLDEEINRLSNKLDRISEVKDEYEDKEHMVMLKNIEDINSLINNQEKSDIKEINVLKMNSSNFSKVIDNFWIIKRLYEEENKSIEFIARWLRMPKLNLLLWINRYFKHLRKLDELNIKHKLKEERVNKIKNYIFEFLDINRRRWVTVLQMVEHINNWVFKDNQDNKTNYYEVYSWLKNEMNFGWRKSSQRLPRWFQVWLEEARKVFKDYINKLLRLGLLLYG